MTEEDVIRLVHQVQGQQEVDAMRAALEKNIDALRNLNLVEVDFDRRQATMQATVRASATQFLRAEEAMNKAGTSSRNFGQSLLTAGRGVQDFQAAGLPGILNNIEGLTMALGGPAGLAGVFTAVAVGIQVFMPQIKELYRTLTGEGIKSVDDLSGSIAGLEKQIKELEEKPTKIALDLQMLDAAKEKLKGLQEAAAAFKAIELTTAEADFGAAMTKLVKDTIGGPALARSLSEVRTAAPDLFAPVESEEKLAEVMGRLKVAEDDRDELRALMIRKEIAPLEAAIPAEKRKQVEDLAAQFGKGEIVETGRVRAMVGRMPGGFAPEFREALANMPGSPGALAAEKFEEEQDRERQATIAARAGQVDRRDARIRRDAAKAKAEREREEAAMVRRNEREKTIVERQDRERTAAARAAGIAGLQAAKQAAPEVEATIGGIGMGPVATAKATQRALQQISTGNRTQMDAVMVAVDEVMKMANLMSWDQKAYAANFLRMARQNRQNRTGRQH